MTLVIDASLALAWYFEDESTVETVALHRNVAESEAVVPVHWRLEVASGFPAAVRRRRMDKPHRDACLAGLAVLPIVYDQELVAHCWSDTLRLADEFGLTIYNATYLELALGRKLPLRTLDQDLRQAARASGVPIAPT